MVTSPANPRPGARPPASRPEVGYDSGRSAPRSHRPMPGGLPWVGKGHVASPTVCKTAAKAVGVRLPPGPPLNNRAPPSCVRRLAPSARPPPPRNRNVACSRRSCHPPRRARRTGLPAAPCVERCVDLAQRLADELAHAETDHHRPTRHWSIREQRRARRHWSSAPAEFQEKPPEEKLLVSRHGGRWPVRSGITRIGQEDWGRGIEASDDQPDAQRELPQCDRDCE